MKLLLKDLSVSHDKISKGIHKHVTPNRPELYDVINVFDKGII